MSGTGLEIAVVGLACRFPGAPDAARYWRNLCDGTESITTFARPQLLAAGVPEALLDRPDYVPAQGVLAGYDLFDAEFFGVSPREAALMDPQHRVLLECAWQALEDAGFEPPAGSARVGVYAGAYYDSYVDNLVGHVDLDDPGAVFARNIANEKDYLASRIAYKLDLAGPAVTVQTACSTSLVAVHLACQSLLSGSCDTALAGGATARARQLGYIFEPGGIFSADGHCRPFDAKAQGTVPANGVGVVALRRLEDAIADGDPIRAVITGSAIGNDGADRVGFTAPGAAGQARIIRAALEMAETDPVTVSYVEAHGSGTPVGDPIEVTGLSRAFAGVDSGRCAIGSVKGNIGHTHAAAGVAGLIKTVLAVQHGLLPPSLHFDSPNPGIDFAATPFRVATRLTEWPAGPAPRRAAVSSFGMGGTGAHVVVEQAPSTSHHAAGRRHHLLPVSARSEIAVERAVDQLADHLAATADLPVATVARTLQSGRRHFDHRRFVVVDDNRTAAKVLRERDRRRLGVGCRDQRPLSVVFLFPGTGEQRAGMGHELYAGDPVFRAEFDRCADALRPHLHRDLRTMVYPTDPVDETELDRTCFAQPAMFAIEYALAKLWQSWGVRPEAMVGYSVGEYVAACLSGVYSLDDALMLVARRAALIEQLPHGAMLAVPLSEQRLSEILDDYVSITAVNGPELCVVGGAIEAIAALEQRLAGERVAARRLRTAHAFHSRMMEPIMAEFAELVATIPLHPPAVPYVSTLTGDWITAAQARDPGFWARHLRHPVRFGQAVTRVSHGDGRLLLEVGPGRSLSSLARRLRLPDTTAHPSLPGESDRYGEEEFLLTTAGKIWTAGVDLDWSAVRGGAAGKTSLPAYPFERQRHWLDPVASVPGSAPSLAKKADLADWFHVPVWEPAAPRVNPSHQPGPVQSWLVFLDEQDVGAALARRLADAGHEVTTVRAGAEWHRVADRSYEIAPADDDHYRRLVQEVGLPDKVVHLWSVGPRGPLDQMLERGLGSLMRLNHVVEGLPLDLVIVTDDAYAVLGTEDIAPEKATTAGPCLVLPLEQPETRCRAIDISLDRLDGDAVLAEVLDPSGQPFTALRGRRRWHRTHRPVRLPAGADEPPAGGAYLITGGFGGIGLALARHLARSTGAGLVLIGRGELPPRDAWDGTPADHPHAGRIAAVRELEELGATVLARAADVTDACRMAEVADEAVARFGAVHGIVHAAGVPADGLAQLKDVPQALRVLAPKVPGGLVVDALARRLRPQFTVYCSSTLALTGGVGQIDYVAANAFLDALAERGDVTGGPRTVSVNWDAWRDVGMAARIAGGGRTGPVDHPLLTDCLVDEPDLAVYAVSLTGGACWLASEHRVGGIAVIPGAGHLELARAAFAHHSRGSGVGVELSDVAFQAPVVVPDQQPPELRVVLEGERFSVVSRQQDGDGTWQVHVTGVIRAGTTGVAVEPPEATDPAMRDVGEITRTALMSFGPRFDCLRRLRVGDSGAIAEVELTADFAADLDHMALHPALLDAAAGCYGTTVARRFRVPVSYGRLSILAPLTRRITVHHRFHEADLAERPVFRSDVTVTDERGTVLAHIADLTLKHVPDLDQRLTAASAGKPVDAVTRRLPLAQGRTLLREHVTAGIDPAEGVDAFLRVIASGVGPTVAVAAKDLRAVRADIAERATAATDRDPAAPSNPRPEGLSEYEAPADELERLLATQWADLLGIDRVGADDDVYELGAHSLLGLQYVGRVRRSLGIDLPLAALFESATVRQLAAVLRPQLEDRP